MPSKTIRAISFLPFVALMGLGACDTTDLNLYEDKLVVCHNVVAKSTRSPDGTRVAYLFERACGEQTEFSTEIAILPAGVKPEVEGNVYRADTGNGRAPSAHWGGPFASIRWINAATLQVGWDPRSRVFKADQVVDGVTIRYVHDSRPR